MAWLPMLMKSLKPAPCGLQSRTVLRCRAGDGQDRTHEAERARPRRIETFESPLSGVALWAIIGPFPTEGGV